MAEGLKYNPNPDGIRKSVLDFMDRIRSPELAVKMTARALCKGAAHGRGGYDEPHTGDLVIYGANDLLDGMSVMARYVSSVHHKRVPTCERKPIITITASITDLGSFTLKLRDPNRQMNF